MCSHVKCGRPVWSRGIPKCHMNSQSTEMSPLNHRSADAAQMSTFKRRGEQDGRIQETSSDYQGGTSAVDSHGRDAVHGQDDTVQPQPLCIHGCRTAAVKLSKQEFNTLGDLHLWEEVTSSRDQSEHLHLHGRWCHIRPCHASLPTAVTVDSTHISLQRTAFDLKHNLVKCEKQKLH